MTQYYIVEIKQYPNGEYEHQVYYAWDGDAKKARLKGESKYYEILSSAAVSENLVHSAIMFGTDGFPYLYHSFEHPVAQTEPESLPDEQDDKPIEDEEGAENGN